MTSPSNQSNEVRGVVISGSIGNIEGDIVGGNKSGLDEAKVVDLLNKRGIYNNVLSVASSFLPTFLGILMAPRKTMQKIASSAELREESILFGAIPFGLISLFVSSFLAASWNIHEKPNLIDLTLVVSTFFIWVFVSLPIHIGLKIIGGRGGVDATVAAVIYATGVVSLSAVPMVGGLSYFTTNTQVTLTYPYLISYGYGDWREIYFVLSPIDFRTQERFIREDNPGRESTVLAPISTLEPPPVVRGGRGPADFDPFSRRDEQRIPREQSTYEPPKKSLSASIKPNSETLWLGVSVSYFWIMYFYMACLLSVVHKRNAIVLFFIALLGPPAAFMGGLYALAALLFWG